MDAPAARAQAITPSDSVDLPVATRAVYIGGAGNLRVETQGGDIVTFSGLPGGFILPVRVARVFATGTTATNLIGLR